MKILFISGSKNREGRTAGAINTIIEAAEKAGAETETVFLPELKLEHCRQCDADGWGICRLTESMKAFLDRFRRISAFNEKPVTAGKSAAGLCLAGGGGNFAVQACLNLEATLQMCRFDVVDMMPVRRQNYEMKLPMLKLTGEWLATKPVSNPQ